MQPSESPSPPTDILSMIVTAVVVLITGFISVARRIIQDGPTRWIVIMYEYSACLLVGYLAWEAFPSIQPHLPDWLGWVSQNMISCTGAWIGIRAFHVAEHYTSKKFDTQT